MPPPWRTVSRQLSCPTWHDPFLESLALQGSDVAQLQLEQRLRNDHSVAARRCSPGPRHRACRSLPAAGPRGSPTRAQSPRASHRRGTCSASGRRARASVSASRLPPRAARPRVRPRRRPAARCACCKGPPPSGMSLKELSGWRFCASDADLAESKSLSLARTKARFLCWSMSVVASAPQLKHGPSSRRIAGALRDIVRFP
jgi:hypothetical protein